MTSARSDLLRNLDDEVLEQRREPGNLSEVQLGEGLEDSCPAVGQLKADDPAVLPVLHPLSPAASLDPVGELDRGVVAEEEIVGDVPDRRSLGITMAPDGEEELVLHVRQAPVPGLLFAPVIEATQLGTKGEEVSILGVRQLGHETL